MRRKSKPKPKPVVVLSEGEISPPATAEQKEQAMRELHASIGFRGWACQEPLKR